MNEDERIAILRRLYDSRSSLNGRWYIDCLDDFTELWDPSLYQLPDSPVRRSLHRLAEEVVVTCWQNSDFGRKELGYSIQQFVARLFRIVRKAVAEIIFDQGQL